jgi:DNA-directed RNA polymerase specialized sigma24 family protein
VDPLEALYRARYAEFVRVARAITGDPERAREAVQDAFANAIRSRRTFRGDGPLDAWVWRSVVNAARKACRHPLVEAGLPGEPAAPIAVRELAPTIASLPERQRLVVFLRYYADLDYRSIAEILGIEVGTVGATLTAAHRAVRDTLQEVQSDA